MYIGSGVITPNKEFYQLNKAEIIEFLKNRLYGNDFASFQKFKDLSFNNNEELIIDYFVSFKNYTIVCDNCVYYQEYSSIDLSEYIVRRYVLREIVPRDYVNNRIVIKDRFDDRNIFVRRRLKNNSK